jgi:Tol biopolymer transport system component
MFSACLRRAISALVLLGALLGASGASAATLLDPRLRFRTIETAHFLIHFHQGEERLAARFAPIAEDVWSRVGSALLVTAPQRTHVILADQTELANGWATPIPYNTIFITAAAPPGSEYIGNEDDWLRLVFTHEFTHIVHLDRSEGWARIFRGLFGRTPVAFPNLWLPGWQIEGLASFEESRITGAGRLYAGDFRAIEREAARTKGVEPIDRVNGGLTDWPGGLSVYAYGLGFHEFLADRFGEARLAALADATARSIPFLSAMTFEEVFGQSVTSLWQEYQRRTAARAEADANGAAAASGRARQLTTIGFNVVGPRFAVPSCDTCTPAIVFSARDPHAFPSLMSIPADGGSPERLAPRYFGSTAAVRRDWVIFDQQELRRNTGVYSDLFAMDRRSGGVRALTREARLQDPDLSPDGTRLVAVREADGRRDLVLVPLEGVAFGELRTGEPVVLASDENVQFSAPRWSPDGRLIVAARHRLGHRSEIVTVDAASRTTRLVAADAHARIVTPAWTPDGRYVIAAADFGERPFQLYAFDVMDSSGQRVAEGATSAIRLTSIPGGALWPDVSSDGDRLTFAGYTAAGFDVFVTPVDLTGERVTLSRADTDRPQAAAPSAEPAAFSSRPYSPWSTLVPTTWTPILLNDGEQVRLGGATGGADVLGRHQYFVSATFQVSGPQPAAGRSRALPDWNVAYSYDRWRAVPFFSASRETTFNSITGAASATRPRAVIEREAQMGVLVPVHHARATHRALAAVVAEQDEYAFAARTEDRQEVSLRAGVATSSAKIYGYSISPEHGISAGLATEITREALGADGDATTLGADLRAYLPGFSEHHVLALHAAGGHLAGARGLLQPFTLGGATTSDILQFDSDGFGLLRGFPSRRFFGRNVAVVNVDYRWPIARPQRGINTWPLFLHSVHAAVAADAGHAWDARFRAADVKLSLVGEVSFDLVAAYTLPFTVAVGGGIGHDGAASARDAAGFVRVGYAF